MCGSYDKAGVVDYRGEAEMSAFLALVGKALPLHAPSAQTRADR